MQAKCGPYPSFGLTRRDSDDRADPVSMGHGLPGGPTARVVGTNGRPRRKGATRSGGEGARERERVKGGEEGEGGREREGERPERPCGKQLGPAWDDDAAGPARDYATLMFQCTKLNKDLGILDFCDLLVTASRAKQETDQ